MKEDQVTPIPILTARKAASKAIPKEKLNDSGDWPDLTDEHIQTILTALSADGAIDGTPVYIAGGKLHSLDDGKLTVISEHPAAKPYLWPIAHDVRPAAQSLGSRTCQDCHSIDAPFFFGKVCIDSPVRSQANTFKRMIDMYKVDGSVYVRVNRFFKLLIIGTMSLLILHILGDLFRRVMSRLAKPAK
jgi:hypothetical protein